MIGTATGAVAIVVLSACFPQNRVGFLLGLALWGTACGFATTLLRNLATFAPALAGFSAIIIANAELGATGGTSSGVFLLAVARASDVFIGIICAGAILVASDLGGARRRLAAQLAAVSAEIAERFVGALSQVETDRSAALNVRRELIRRVIALDSVIDEALGEASDLRPDSPILQAAVDGLFAAIYSWQAVARHLGLLPIDQARRGAGLVRHNLPPELHSASSWLVGPSGVRKAYRKAVRALTALPVRTPSARLLTARTAAALIGIERALNGLVLLVDPVDAIRVYRPVRFHVPDLLPAFVNGARVFVTIGAVELFWVATAWPNGVGAITFAALVVIFLSARGDEAYAAAKGIVAALGLAAVFAATVKFAVLPGIDGFAGFSFAIGLVLFPAGALMVKQPAIGTLTAAFFILMLGPANQMNYDTQQFYNAALADVAGGVVGALSFRLLPPLSPAIRTRRLLLLTLWDLRRLTRGPIPRTAVDWRARIYGHLRALPDQADPLQRAQLLTALSIGIEIIRLRRIAHRFDLQDELDAALDAVARGDSALAIERLGRVDRMITVLPDTKPGAWIRLRARGSILAMSEALAQHAAYFDFGAT
jgi:uncharacterized membrane protein YccC